MSSAGRPVRKGRRGIVWFSAPPSGRKRERSRHAPSRAVLAHSPPGVSGLPDPTQLQAALQAINARRRADGIPELAAFGAYLPPAPTTPKEDDLAAGQALLLKRRAECGVAVTAATGTVTTTPVATAPVTAPSPSLDAILDSLHPARRSGQQPAQAPAAPPAPRFVAVWTQLALRASRTRHAGAIRAWIFARHADPRGSGVVSHDELIGLLERLGVARSTRFRWVREALAADFLSPARGGSVYLIRSAARVCRVVGAAGPGLRCEVDARALARSGWKGLLWAARLAAHARPVSRAYLQQATGVPASTQKVYGRAGRVKSTANYAVDMASSPDQLDGYREFKKPHAFLVKCGGSQRVAYRLPNTYQPPSTVRTAGGQARAGVIRQQIGLPAVSDFSESAPPCEGALGGRERADQGAFAAGGASRTAFRRLYYAAEADLRKRARYRQRKGLQGEPGGAYLFLAGGIAKRARISHSQWWMLLHED